MWRILLFTYSLLLSIVGEESFPIEYLGKVEPDRLFISPQHDERSIDRPVLRHACLSRERGGLKLAISTVIATCSGDASTPPALQRRQRSCIRIVQEQWAKRNIDDAAAAWLSVCEQANACTNSRLYTGCPGAIFLHYSKFLHYQKLYFFEKRSWKQLLFCPTRASLIFVNDLFVKYFDTWVTLKWTIYRSWILYLELIEERDFVRLWIFIYILFISDRRDLISLSRIYHAN